MKWLMILLTVLALSSCAHHGKSCCKSKCSDKKQCDMKKKDCKGKVKCDGKSKKLHKASKCTDAQCQLHKKD